MLEKRFTTLASGANVPPSILSVVQDDFSNQDETIKKEWFRFFTLANSGCLFAAKIAKNPNSFGWYSEVLSPFNTNIQAALDKAVEDPNINTISLIFPSVTTLRQLESLIAVFEQLPNTWCEFSKVYEQSQCLGFRLKIDRYVSWVTGFGPFEFLPRTRRAPYTSLTLRVKPKPVYEWVMKSSPNHELHLADINIGDIGKIAFQKLWDGSFAKVEALLGHRPDLRSAAKTTFSLPINDLDNGDQSIYKAAA